MDRLFERRTQPADSRCLRPWISQNVVDAVCARQALIASRIAALTERERAVLRRIIEGKPNKIIAGELDISMKTVEFHRSKLMEKMGADSVAALVQLTLGFSPVDALPPEG